MRLACDPAMDATAIHWQEVPCPSCATDRVTPLLEAADALASGQRFLIVCCKQCGLCYTNPRPDPASIARFYPLNYHCHRSRLRVSKSDSFDRWLQSGTRLLDFGCGAGTFLLHMRERGWNVVGLDNAPGVAERLHSNFGLEVQTGTLPNARFAAGSFDAITMRQSLEHVHEPRLVLQDARRLLTDGGRLIVSVPNFDALAMHWFRADWYGLDLPRHLTHFTPTTLRAMLNAAGFADVTLHSESHPSWIRKSAGSRRWLKSRLGSGIASRWARLLGRAESLVAVATK